jgi:uncharacterized protein (TIGR03790 family)
MMVWWMLHGCGGPDGATDTDLNTDTTGDCDTPISLSLSGTPAPGATLTLDVSGADTVLWTVTGGVLESDTALSTSWTLPDIIAVNEAESLTAQAEVSGCTEEVLAETVTVDWTAGERVAVLFNPLVEGSEDVARHYADFREVPEQNLCGISTEADTTLDGADLEDWLDALTACLEEAGPQVMYLVPVYGTPYRVSDRIALTKDYAVTTVSLDALAVIHEIAATSEYAIYNPFYQSGDSTTQTYSPYIPFAQLRADFTDQYGISALLVSRIDGESAEAAMALVDRTEQAEALAAAGKLSGTVYVDGRYGDKEPADDSFGSYSSGEWNMWGTRYLFEELDWYPVVWDGNAEEFGTSPAPEVCRDALYYAGWYSYYNYNDAFEWTTGAIGGHLDSCSACDIRSGATWSGGALQRGITATFGAVAEPYVAGMPEYDQFFAYLTQGANFAEAGYESTIIGFWMMTWIGDPLYRPYP